MMTLIGTAISVAFFFSAATVFFPVGNDFFWELATLIDIMLLGHWIEAENGSRRLKSSGRISKNNAYKSSYCEERRH